jgi:hypothetical protein
MDFQFYQQRWPAIFGGINEHLNDNTPFRRITLWLWQRLDVICDIAQRAGRRSTRKGNRLVKWTVPRHDLCQPQRELPIRTGVAIDKVAKGFRNVLTIHIAARLDFQRDIT